MEIESHGPLMLSIASNQQSCSQQSINSTLTCWFLLGNKGICYTGFYGDNIIPLFPTGN